MRLFIDNTFFVSVIQETKNFSLQVMQLVNGNGMYNTTVTENPDAVSCIVHQHPFSETNKTVSNLKDVCGFHKQRLLELEKARILQKFSVDYVMTEQDYFEEQGVPNE